VTASRRFGSRERYRPCSAASEVEGIVMMKVPSPARIAGVTLLLIACSTDHQPQNSIEILTLSGGGRHVRNPDNPNWEPGAEWQVIDDLRIGQREGDGPDVFGDIVDLAVDGAGRIYVLDRFAKEIRVFDAQGAYVQRIGGEGSGPGEFRAPIAIRWMSGRGLLVVDPGNGRYSVIDSTGQFVGTVRRPVTDITYPWPGGIDGEGFFYDVSSRISSTGESRRIILRIDSVGNPRDTFSLPAFTPMVFELRTDHGRLTAEVPYAPRLLWLLDASSHHLWFGTTDRYSFWQRSLAGDTTAWIDLGRRRVPVSADEREGALRSLDRFVERGGTVDPSRIPATKPFFSRILLDPSGDLWVVRSGQGKAGFDVFRQDGVYLGHVVTHLAYSRIPPVVTDRAMYGVLTDSLDVAYVVRAAIVRPPS
jgi:DNA-binding beta-propeller fold protein YncE